MTDNFFDFPSERDWLPIEQNSSMDDLFSLLDKFKTRIDENQDGLDPTTLLSLDGFIDDLYQRLRYVGQSYILMMYYYGKGIPDEKFHSDSPSDGRYWYPKFREEHWSIKGWFDYFSDVFYYQIFSIWDCIGHILNEQYHLDIKFDKVTFNRAVDSLKSTDKKLFQGLKDVIDSDVYRAARKIRHDITHNHLPNVPGMIVVKQESPPIGISNRIYAMKNYLTANQLTTNATDSLDLFAKILKCIINYSE